MVDSFFGTPDLGVTKGDEIVGEVIVGDENVDECGNSLTEGPVCLAGRVVGSVVGGGGKEIVGREGGNSLTECTLGILASIATINVNHRDRVLALCPCCY